MRKKREEGEGVNEIIYIKSGDPELNAILAAFTDCNFINMLVISIASQKIEQKKIIGNLKIVLN